jgi:hypothetical protein
MDYNVNLSEFYVWLKNKEALYIWVKYLL